MNKRPTNRSHFEKLISQVSKQEGVEPARLRRWVSQMVIVGAINRVIDEEDPKVVLKGGVTMELRFAISARTTRDLDAIIVGSRNQAERILSSAFDQSYEGFSFQMTPPQAVANTTALQCNVKLAYESRPWSTEKLEFSLASGPVETEQLTAIDLATFGLAGPNEISCLSLRYQIAQKIHALTAEWEGRENPRFRDIVDLLLMLPAMDDLGLVKAACVKTFEARGTHGWPPTLVAYDSWREPYAVLSERLGLKPYDLDSAIVEIHDALERIDKAK